MSTQTFKRHAVAASIMSTAILVAAATPAQASPFTLQSNGFNTTPTSSVTISHPSFSGTVNAGAIKFTATDQAPPGTIESFVAYCIELSQFLGSTVTDYTRTTPGTLYSASVETAIKQLYSISGAYANSLTNANASAAFQLALWEITNEGASAGTDLTSGNFTAAPGAITTAASNLLTSLGAIDSNLAFTAWTSPTHQNFLQVTTRSKVPEPSSLALLGLGLFAFGVRRLRK